MGFLEERIQQTCTQLWSYGHQKVCDINQVEYQESNGYKQNNVLPTDGWKPFPAGSRVHGRDAHFWFRTRVHTPPAKENTTYYVRYTTGFEGKRDATNPQGLVYANGEMVQGCDTNHTDVYLESDTDYTLHNYFYVGLTDAWIPLKTGLYALDERSEQLYYDMKVALDCAKLQHPNSDEYIAIMTVLEQTANLLDLRDPRSDAYYKSLESAIAYIGDALYTKLCTTEGKPVVSCIGHTHIDVEYLWARKQTREKIQRSFATAATLMKRYPEYLFMLSQPELYRYLKEEAPEKYDELKQLVKEGRWEPEGAMYVESDCNLISGESLVRQILQGKKFFKDEFGIDCKVLFLPDVFGYSAAMPQILMKCGIRHFVTSKISWNETNTLPVDCFMWQGIDGTEIFTNFITTQNYTGPDASRGTTYVGRMTPSEVKGTWNKFQQREYANRALTTYGHGDGGGGPTKAMLENQRRMAKGLPGMPVTKPETLLHHLDQLRQEFDAGCVKTRRTPKWVGELYLEYHRGTYTSIAKNKRNNRKSELMLQMAETLSYTDLLFGGNYDADGIYQNWTKVLHNQFHDIIPGSSIKEVYDGTDKDYAKILGYCDNVVEEKLAAIASKVDTQGAALIYNPLGFAQKGVVELDGVTAELTEEIPAFGWGISQKPIKESSVSIHGLTAENKYYILTLDQSGRIISLFDKAAGRAVLKAGTFGNELQAFEDFPRAYDNWEISDYYKQKMWVLDEDAVIEPAIDGSRAGFKIIKSYMHSTITQCLWLYSESRRIDFQTEIDWHEHHQILKAAFPLDVLSSTATYDIQFGHVQRPTHENTSWDKAKFEVYGHKWVDISESGYGVSLLNDCKYGYNTEGSTLKLTMLKCGTYPNPEADQGRHVFTYSLVPHIGDFRSAGIIQEAYALNQPLVATKSCGSGTLPGTFSLVSCDQPGIIIETVKKAEADNGMIVRMYEAFGGRCTANITVAPGFSKAYLCDLMENELQELSMVDNRVTLPMSNFEVTTLKYIK